MAKTNFVVFSEDEDYAYSWGRYVSKRKGIPFEVKIFSEERKLKEFTKVEKINILLLDSKEEVKDISSEVKFVLYENDREKKYADDTHYIDKFQSANSIITQISEACIKEKKDYLKQNKESEKIKVIGIYSPVNRCFKTMFSIALASALSKKNPTLYLNFEEYSCLKEVFSVNSKNTISELIYYYKIGAEFLGMRFLAALNRWDKLDFLLSPVCKEDIKDLSSEEFSGLIDKIKKIGDYHYIVIDLGNAMNNIPKILDYVDEVIMPVRNDNISQEKIRDFENYLKERDSSEILDKISKLDLSFYKDKIKGTDIEHIVNSEFGVDIRNMAEEYLENGKWNLKH